MSGRRRIEGYAIVSADGMIADATASCRKASRTRPICASSRANWITSTSWSTAAARTKGSRTRRAGAACRADPRRRGDRARSGQPERRAVEPGRRVVRSSLRGAGARGRRRGGHRRTPGLYPVPRRSVTTDFASPLRQGRAAGRPADLRGRPAGTLARGRAEAIRPRAGARAHARRGQCGQPGVLAPQGARPERRVASAPPPRGGAPVTSRSGSDAPRR